MEDPAQIKNPVAIELCDGIAVLKINNPPVNAGSHAVRTGLLAGIDKAQRAKAQGAVILGAGRCFVAGSDLKEFGKPLQSPELPEVIAAIEQAPFPVVAALHGVALGGGLELALGCDYRIAAPQTMLGLPEVSLGFVPGAGGTQRLPRLIGVARGIEMICTAKRIPASEALEIGLIDALAKTDLKESALTFLHAQNRPKRRTLDAVPPAEPLELIENAATRAQKRAKGHKNVPEAIRLIRATTDTAPAQALAEERAVFQTFRRSDEAFALRHLFFAERRASTVDGLDATPTIPVAAVGVIGGGTMGQGIMRTLLAADLPVTFVEQDGAARDAALSQLQQSLQDQVARGRLTEAQVQIRLKHLQGATTLSAVSKCDLVIEAIYEDMALKTNLLGALETVTRSDAILATNTSYLDINQMAQSLKNPQRVIGLHFFCPADVMKLLEVVRTAQTSDRTLATGLKLARSLGKQAIVSAVAEGFIGNRIYAAYRRRAELLVLDGSPPEDVDRAATQFGFAMGPFAVSDLSGLDIAWATRKRQAATRDPMARYVTIPDKLCAAGRLGRKSGKGWYDYSSGQPKPDAETAAIIDAARQEAAITPQQYETATLQRQLMAAILNESACLLEDGVAQRPSDVDVALVNGYGFPRWRGGPLYWGAQQDRQAISQDLAMLRNAIGHGFREGPVHDILADVKRSLDG